MSWQLILAGVIGACIGSFLNVVSLRYGKKNFWYGRSSCPDCQHALSRWELVPVLSFIALRGSCRTCGQKISWQYPVVELITATAFMWAFPSLRLAVIFSLFIVLFLIDLRTMILPDIYILVLTLATLPGQIAGALLGSGLLFALWAITRGRGLGLGDVKLMIPLGLLFGPLGTLTLLFFAFVSGGLLAAILLATGRVTLKTAVPFGPFLLLAAAAQLLWPALPNILWL